MNRQLNLFLCLMAMFVGGCASWQNTTGKALATTAQTVDSAMKGWAVYVVTANPPADQQAKVKAAYDKYQLAMDGALRAYNAAVTLKDQSIYVQASAALQAASRDILALIQAFHPTTK